MYMGKLREQQVIRFHFLLIAVQLYAIYYCLNLPP